MSKKDFFSEADCDLNVSRYDQTTHEYIITLAAPSLSGISLDKANRLLRERGRVMQGFENASGGFSFHEKANDGLRNEEYDTHQALLICVEEIEKDSVESLLKKLIEIGPAFYAHDGVIDLIERAKKLLEREEK